MILIEKNPPSSKSRILTIIPFFLGLMILVSCSGGIQKEDLVGTWIGTDFNFEQSEGGEMAAMIEGGRMLHEDGRLELNENGTFRIFAGKGDLNGLGTWEIDGGDLVMNYDVGEVTRYEILSFTDKELVTKHEVEFESPLGKIAGIITLTYRR
ncbi:lipocalin family protein [Algoriphagus limi]|uniref:Lipocalin family protein n=1 Tax=Algoriphagus limi TaxID=2975273 RepID=A0ABT2G3T7_9BACT|nr:lipocalin family protein [Algoriphagus limi]MCS5489931.1 lipocalin family protein [Algoriphagus limi]